jgi:hypothetical protein
VQGRAGSELLVVDGTLYLFDPAHGGWVMAGDPSSIDPDSGTTPDESLAAVGEDVGGATLHRITDGMAGLTTRQLGNGSTVYSGSLAAGLIAKESGVKGGQPIRVFPFGYVAHDEAANPAAALQAAVTVGADGIIREITVIWGTGPAQPQKLSSRMGSRAEASACGDPVNFAGSVTATRVSDATAYSGTAFLRVATTTPGGSVAHDLNVLRRVPGTNDFFSDLAVGVRT